MIHDTLELAFVAYHHKAYVMHHFLLNPNLFVVSSPPVCYGTGSYVSYLLAYFSHILDVDALTRECQIYLFFALRMCIRPRIIEFNAAATAVGPKITNTVAHVAVRHLNSKDMNLSLGHKGGGGGE
jgi:hypothetical protein